MKRWIATLRSFFQSRFSTVCLFPRSVMRSCVTWMANLRVRSATSSSYLPETARLAFLTTAEGKLVLNIQTEENTLKRFEVNRGQLAGITIEATRALLMKEGGL